MNPLTSDYPVNIPGDSAVMVLLVDDQPMIGEAVRRARIVVDTREGALEEAGDLLIPMGEGVIEKSAIATQLSDLLQGRGARRDDGEITLFKSVGYALEDLIAARLLVQ